MVCQRQSAACILATCDRCSNGAFSVVMNPTEDDEPEEKIINWRRWSDFDGPVQVDIKLHLLEAIDQVNALLPGYKMNTFIKDEQRELFKSCKVDIHPDCAILQVDFAENFAAVSQDEVQS